MSRVLCVGHAVQDYVFHLPELPRHPEKYRARDFACVGGGPAATAAVAIVRLGGSAQLVARVGEDAVAETIRAELEHYGVDCRYLARLPGRRSSLSSVFIDAAGERLIVNYTDPDMPIATDWLRAVSLDDCAAVLADTRWPAGSRVLLQRARESGLPAVLDADVPVPRDTDLLQASSHVAFSAIGLRDFLAQPTAPVSELLPALQKLAQQLQRWCCVTLGASGVAYTDGDTVALVPAFAVSTVDTLGAGDVWHGAFALALGEGSSAAEAVRFASAVAAIKVGRRGGRDAVPTRAEVMKFLQDNT